MGFGSWGREGAAGGRGVGAFGGRDLEICRTGGGAGTCCRWLSFLSEPGGVWDSPPSTGVELSTNQHLFSDSS